VNTLKRCRKARDIRQVDLARLAHVAQADIVSFEKGRRLPSIGQAKRIAEFYVLCWKCRTRSCLKMETSRRLIRNDPVCPSCGAELKVPDDQASKAVG
jgi:predicted transcriptional regulator